ncbi:cell division protein FtsQ/DivIB [Butyricicoccus pullicaecorum]|uniref:cell division protein FtsQ/DivIB n=1 Tax=Butyricicoccus pullicaecorum TaxID=501571 RepID=UPI0039909B52
MAKRENERAQSGEKREQLTGLDRFAVPERTPTQTGGNRRTGENRAKRASKQKKQTASRSGSAPARTQTAQPSGKRTQAKQGTQPSKRPSGQSGMTARVQGTQKLTPQKQGVTQRPLGGGRTGRDRVQHLRKIVRRKERRARLTKIIAVLLSLVCGVLALTAFFRVEQLEIVGLTRYETQDVLNTFGIKQGDNLFFCDSLRGQKRLLAQYPYFESVSVERDLPSRMVVTVKEAQPIAAVNSTQGGWFVLDKDCRVLERTDQEGAKDAAEVLGLRTPGAEPGQTLPAEDPEALEALKTLANGLDKVGLGGKATLYNLQDLDSIWFLYEERFAVCVGDTKNLDHKLAILQALVTGDQFSPSDKGSINLALGDRAITNTSLSAGEVEKTARGQATIQHIENTSDDTEGESDQDTSDSDSSEEE